MKHWEQKFQHNGLVSNRKDRLADKLEKMKTKQFPLIYEAASASVFEALQLDVSAIKQHYCLKAFLFIPKKFQQHALPKEYRECLAGHYIKWTELDSEKNSTALYALPQKKEWLLPPKSITNWLSYPEAKEAIKNSIAEKRSPLVYKKGVGGIEKFFVVWW